VALGIVQHRRLDVIGALVLAGIVVGTVVGLASHSARLVLMEGSVFRHVFRVITAVWGIGRLAGSRRLTAPYRPGLGAIAAFVNVDIDPR
jgi:hypothetical protein